MDLVSGFFWFCKIKGSKSYIKILLVVSLRKNLIWGYLIFLGYFLLFYWVWPKLNQAAVTNDSLNSQNMIIFMIINGFWNSQDMISIHDKNSSGPLSLCENRMPRKNLVLKLWPKMALSQWDFRFFNQQYFINRLTSDFDVSNVDRHEWKEQGLSTLSVPLKIGSFEGSN